MSNSIQPTADGHASPSNAPLLIAGDTSVERTFEISPAIQRSQDAFRAALPDLLKKKTASQQWVAFHGDELVTFGRTKTEAYRECLRRGLKRGTFVVRLVRPESPPEAEVLADV